MKKLLLSAALMVGLTFSASAQNTKNQVADTVMLSQYTDGNYQVSNMLIMEQSNGDSEFRIKYKVNASDLNATYSGNSQQLAGLQNFLESVKNDPQKKITRYTVTGYASPDGVLSANEKLAMKRATDFRQFVDSKCGMSTYPGKVDAVAETWSAAAPLIAASAVPNRMIAMDLVDSSYPATTVETKLKDMPSTWNYMSRTILPAMRYVEMEVYYNSWREVAVYTQIAEPAPEIIITEVVEPRVRFVDDQVTGIIFSMNDIPVDYPINAPAAFSFKERAHGNHDKLKFREADRYARERVKEKSRTNVARGW